MRFLSSRIHTIIGLIVGVLLLFAPQLFSFDSQAATSVAMGVGVFIIVSELVTTSPYGLLKLVPMRIHLVLDYLTGAFLLLSPWLFGFADDAANEWVPHVIVGILVIGYALMTNPATDSKDSTVPVDR
jgi:hypothetical protein